MSYYTKITKAGLAAITAAMNNSSKVPISYMAFGDGNGNIPEPNEDALSLVNEVYRVGVNKVEVHNKNPNWLVCEAIIPSAVGGFNIREVALYDQTGNTMLAVASYPPTYKPTVEEGAAKIQTIRIVIQVDNSGNFELIVDPDVVLATIEYVDSKEVNVDNVKGNYRNQNLINKDLFINVKDYGAKVDGVTDDTSAVHRAFAENPKCTCFYIPAGTMKANIIYPKNFIKLVGDGLLNTFIEPFDLTKPAVSFNKKLYPTIEDLTIQAGQDYSSESLLDATDTRYMTLRNFDIRKTKKTGETDKYETILIDQRTQTWTGYNTLINVRAVSGAYGYLADPDKLNSVLSMIDCVFAQNGYFNIKTSASNSTLICMDIAGGGQLKPVNVFDETMFGGVYLKGDNTIILGAWHEYNAASQGAYSPNNIYIHPSSKNITHNFSRDSRSSNNVRIFNESQGQLLNCNLADQALDDGLGKDRNHQLIKNGSFKHWGSNSRPLNWGGYFNGTVSKETSDLPKGYESGLKIVSTASGISGIYQNIYNPNNLEDSYIKDINKWIGREISVTLWFKNIGLTGTTLRAGISTDPASVYLANGQYISTTEIGKWTKIVINRKIIGNEPHISVAIRVAGVGEGFITTGFSVNDGVRVADYQPKPITEDGGKVFGPLEVNDLIISNKSILFIPEDVTSSQLTLLSSSVNNIGKFRKKLVFNTTDNKFYYAVGSTAESAWISFDNSVTINPSAGDPPA